MKYLPLALSLVLWSCSPAVQAPIVSVERPSASAGLSRDTEIEAQLTDILKSFLPSANLNAIATELTLEHAKQIANQPTQSDDFQILQAHSYEPISPTALERRLIAKNLYVSDNLVSAFLSDGDPEALKQRFKAQMKKVVGVVPFSGFGLSVVKKGQAWYVSTILLTEIVTLEGLNQTFKAGDTLAISGKINLAAYRDPQILLTRPDGTVAEIPTQSQGERFSAQIPLSDSGLYSFEVDVQGPLGPQPATNLVLAVGRELPALRTRAVEAVAIVSLAAAQAELLEQINRDRQAIGLNALTLDPQLNQAAQAHSEDMLQNGFVGHHSPTHGVPQQQAFRFNITDLISQNIALSRSVSQAHQELMSSPGHRQTILNPSHTQAGFGLTTDAEGLHYITELFTLKKISLDPLPRQVRRGETVTITGTSQSDGFLAAVIQKDGKQNVQTAVPVEVKNGDRIHLTATFTETGKQRLQIGLSGPPINNNYNLQFHNIWDLEVIP